jgi:hypothetical protein
LSRATNQDRRSGTGLRDNLKDERFLQKMRESFVETCIKRLLEGELKRSPSRLLAALSDSSMQGQYSFDHSTPVT